METEGGLHHTGMVWGLRRGHFSLAVSAVPREEWDVMYFQGWGECGSVKEHCVKGRGRGWIMGHSLFPSDRCRYCPHGACAPLLLQCSVKGQQHRAGVPHLQL